MGENTNNSVPYIVYESMQFRTLENFMKRGMLYSAKEIKNDT